MMNRSTLAGFTALALCVACGDDANPGNTTADVPHSDAPSEVSPDVDKQPDEGPGCTNACTNQGATRCEGNAVETCADYDDDGCLEWGDPQECGAQTCTGGFCAVSCTSECTVAGAKRCGAGDTVETCGDANQDGCLEWGAGVPCQGGTVCSNGFCAVSCSNECTVKGARQCSGNGTQVCADYDFDGCLDWGDVTPCPDGEVCANGTCGSTCTDECNVMGAKQCAGTQSVKQCGDTNGDGCLEWGTAVSCNQGEVCSNGFCATSCQSECSVLGATKCSGNSVQTCGDSNGDGCLEWGTGVPCGDGLVCSNGFCQTTCTNGCTAQGAKTCDGNAVVVCEVGPGGCLAWGTPVGCGEGLSCSNGNCTASCSDECTTVGAKKCEGDAVRTCGDSDADPCLEWGTPVACGDGLVCSNGNCALDCSDECTTEGGRQCAGGGAWQECGDHDSDGCLEWGTAQACEGTQVCSGGNCMLSCVNECGAIGETKCNTAGTAVQTCDDWDDDGCLEWDTGVACDGTDVCSAGQCASSCTDACAVVGDVRCNTAGTGVETCGDYNADGCLEWGTAAPCGVAQQCVGGACADLPPPGQVVINELLFNDAGADDNAFIELFGEPGLDLTGFKLVGVNGANGQDYNDIVLMGALNASGFYVVSLGGPDASIVADQVSAKADYQNGPDSVQLRWGAQVVDAVGYGSFGASDVFAGEGTAVPAPSEGKSIGRDPSGTDTGDNSKDFTAQQAWTPGAPNVFDGNQAPLAALSCPAGGKTGVSLSFSGVGSTDADGAVVAWAFDFGDGTTTSGTASQVSHAYQTVGAKTVTLTVTDDQGAKGSATCVVTIGDANAPTVTFVKPLEDLQVTQGSVVAMTIDATAAPGRSIAQVEILADGVAIGPADALVPYEFTFTVPESAATGSTIALVAQATDSQGTEGLSPVRQLFVKNDKPVASFSAIVTGTLQATVDASGSSDTETATADLEVRWDWTNDGTWDTGWSKTKTATYTYAADGTYTIGLEVRDAVGQVTKATRDINFQSVIDVSGTVTTTLWYGTVNITGDTVVPAGETLTIASGTTIVFVEVDQNADQVGDYELTIQGSLLVEGTEAAPVIFTTLPTSGPADPSSWNGLVLTSGSTATIEHAIVEYAHKGIASAGDLNLSHVELRHNFIGLETTGTKTKYLADVHIHDSADDGWRATNATLSATNVTSKDNGGRGVYVSGGSGTVAGCDLSSNGSHGAELVGTSLSLTQCDILSNGETGVTYRGASTGDLTYSQVKYNAHEGVRALFQGTGGTPTSPTPKVEWNNVFGNATEGAIVVVPVSLSVSTSGSDYKIASTATFTAPAGAVIVGAEVAYNEGTSSQSGALKTSSGTSLLSIGSSISTRWVDLASSKATTLKGEVTDYSSSYGTSLSITKIAYHLPTSTAQVSAVLQSGTVTAQHNFLGTWPNILTHISYSAASHLDIQGFVAEAFDASFDPGATRGALNITGEEVWDTDVFVTGDVTVGTGGTLTIAEGVTVTFVPIDQDGDDVGDFRITRAAGDLVVDGQPTLPVTFTVLGDVPAGGGFEGLFGAGAGTSALTHAIVELGATGLLVSSGTLNATNVETRDHAVDGLYVSGSGTLVATHVTAVNNGRHGLHLISSKGHTVDHALAQNNAGWGLVVTSSPTGTPTAITNSSALYNSAGGVRVANAAVNLSSSHIKYNGYGVSLEGSASGSVTASDLLYNELEGVFARAIGSSNPSTKVNGNNIYGNASAEAAVVESPNLSVSTSGSDYKIATTATWTAPAGGVLMFVKASYTEGTSSQSGRIRTSSGTTLVSLGSSASLQWYDIGSHAATNAQGEVTDYSSSYGTSLSLQKVVYSFGTSNPPRNIEMTAVLQGATIDATANYWGVFPDVPSRIVEADSGAVNYTGFKSSQVTGTGPQ